MLLCKEAAMRPVRRLMKKLMTVGKQCMSGNSARQGSGCSLMVVVSHFLLFAWWHCTEDESTEVDASKFCQVLNCGVTYCIWC